MFPTVTYVFKVGVHLFKVNNENPVEICEICSKLRIKTPERPNWRLYCQLWTDFILFPGDFIVDFEQVNTVLVFGIFMSLIAGTKTSRISKNISNLIKTQMRSVAVFCETNEGINMKTILDSYQKCLKNIGDWPQAIKNHYLELL